MKSHACHALLISSAKASSKSLTTAHPMRPMAAEVPHNMPSQFMASLVHLDGQVLFPAAVTKDFFPDGLC